MTSKLSNLFFLLSLILLVVSNVHLVSSQTTHPVNINENYKVKRGDTKRFDIVKLTNSGINYSLYPFIFKNGTPDIVNLTQGEQIIVKVAEVNTSTPSFVRVYSNLTLITGHHVSRLPLVMRSLFFYPGFDSYSQAESYFNQTKNPPGSNSSFSQSGDILTYVRVVNLDTPVNGSITLSNSGSYPRVFQYITSFNWRTGWLSYEHDIAYFGNGSQDSNFLIQQHSAKDVIQTLFSFSTSFFEVASVIVVLAVLVIVVVSYISYSKISKTSHYSPSFSLYLKNRFTYRKKDAHKRSITETEKALQTIETILDETTNNAK